MTLFIGLKAFTLEEKMVSYSDTMQIVTLMAGPEGITEIQARVSELKKIKDPS